MDLPINYDASHWSIRRKAREQYIKQQDGRCYYCNEPLNHKARNDVLTSKIDEKLFPRNFFKWPVHLHHDRKTGLTLGATHARCNAYMWQYLGE